MNCNRVSHLLSAFMDGELFGYEHRLIHQHLGRCSECREEYEDLLQMKRLLGAMPVREPSKALATSIIKRAYEENGRPAPGDVFLSILRNSGKPRFSAPVLGLGLMAMGLALIPRPQVSENAAIENHRLAGWTASTEGAGPMYLSPVGELTRGLVREQPRSNYYANDESDDFIHPPIILRQQSPSPRNDISLVHWAINR